MEREREGLPGSEEERDSNCPMTLEMEAPGCFFLGVFMRIIVGCSCAFFAICSQCEDFIFTLKELSRLLGEPIGEVEEAFGLREEAIMLEAGGISLGDSLGVCLGVCLDSWCSAVAVDWLGLVAIAVNFEGLSAAISRINCSFDSDSLAGAVPFRGEFVLLSLPCISDWIAEGFSCRNGSSSSSASTEYSGLELSVDSSLWEEAFNRLLEPEEDSTEDLREEDSRETACNLPMTCSKEPVECLFSEALSASLSLPSSRLLL